MILRKKRVPRDSSLEVTQLGLGTDPIGGLCARLDHGQAAEVEATCGPRLSLIDNSLCAAGAAEDPLGRALRPRSRERLVVPPGLVPGSDPHGEERRRAAASTSS